MHADLDRVDKARKGGDMISRVRLRNWKSHMESEFSFSGGVNAIIGIMGSGKTSILQAISFGLYGTFPAHQARRVGLEDLIMKKPQVMGEAEVEIGFSVGEEQYSVLRVLRRGKGTVKAELRKKGRLVEATPQGVTREVSRILDMDYELFSRAVYSEQNAIDYFLTIPRGKRMEHIDRMLRLDRFEKAREGAVSLANRVRNEREEKLRLLSDLRKERLPERIDSLRKELESLEEESGKLEKEGLKAGKEADRLEKELSGLEHDEEGLNEARMALEGVEAGLEQIRSSMEERSSAEKLDRPGLEARLASVSKAVEELESGIRAARRSREEAREKVASLNAEIRIIREGIDDIEKLGDRCPTCEQEITRLKKKELVGTRSAREEKLRGEVSEEAEKARGSEKASEELEGKLKERVAEKEDLRSRIRDFEFLAGLEKRREEYEKRRAALEKRAMSLERGLKGRDLSGIRESLRKAVAEERELAARLDASRQRISDREEMLRELRTREDLLVKYGEESRMDQELGEQLSKFTGAVKLTQDQLREEFLKTVNSVMARIWEELYPYGDFTGIKLAIDRDYVLQLRETGGWVSVEGFASGGERSMAALALRVAFSMAFIPNLKWLILDEPTHNLDSQAIEHFTDSLRERIGSFAEQVFLITHDDRVSEGVGGSIYRLERDKERDGPTQVMA